MRTANPALNQRTLSGVRGRSGEAAMTAQGAINKTALSLLLVVLSASWVWGKVSAGQVMPGLMWGGAIGGFVVAIVTIFNKPLAPITAPIYALLQGLFIGTLSAIFEARYPGIVIQAVTLTFGVAAAMLFAYTSRLIRVTQKFRMMIVAATGGICLVYLASFVMGFFGANIPFIHEGGMMGIGFSLFVVTIAALNLVLDFDLIEQAANAGMPKYMEWYGALALTITLVWLYIEILRLLVKLRGGRR